ncbi:MAG: response regulator transcription factor [Bacteroidia bacterium]
MNNKTAMVLLEDDVIFGDGIQKMISGTKDFYCEARFDTVTSFNKGFSQLTSNIFWVDISLPDGSGIDVIKMILKSKPTALCLVCSLHDDDKHIFEAMKAGASGYLLKNTAVDKMLESLYELQNGGSPMSPYIARKVISSFRDSDSSKSSVLDALTVRESMVLEHIAKGHLYKEVADSLEISIETVKKHLRSIYTKLQVQNRTEAVVKYLNR